MTPVSSPLAWVLGGALTGGGGGLSAGGKLTTRFCAQVEPTNKNSRSNAKTPRSHAERGNEGSARGNEGWMSFEANLQRGGRVVWFGAEPLGVRLDRQRL